MAHNTTFSRNFTTSKGVFRWVWELRVPTAATAPPQQPPHRQSYVVILLRAAKAYVPIAREAPNVERAQRHRQEVVRLSGVLRQVLVAVRVVIAEGLHTRQADPNPHAHAVLVSTASIAKVPHELLLPGLDRCKHRVIEVGALVPLEEPKVVHGGENVPCAGLVKLRQQRRINALPPASPWPIGEGAGAIAAIAVHFGIVTPDGNGLFGALHSAALVG